MNMNETPFFVVKLQGDIDGDCCAATYLSDAVELLGILDIVDVDDVAGPIGEKAILVQVVLATDAGAARIKAMGKTWLRSALTLRDFAEGLNE